MSYVIWNGKKSSDVPGLIICDLPPISKPQIKTEIIEIDGTDGDFVQNLGYKSYTKTISIGLTRNYDIDEVIKYFSGSGILTLSNESDKYYYAQIIDSIDFNKLINFKTASIKFHVQPYKYKLNESNVELNITSEDELIVNNQGLETSNPIITLYGSGLVELSINDVKTLSVNIDSEFIVIDSMNQEAYKNTSLKYRNMIGEFPKLLPGNNKITWNGTLTKIIVNPKSRWL